MRDDPFPMTHAGLSGQESILASSSSLSEFKDWVRDILRDQVAGDDSGSRMIGRFEVISELGRGTFGVVLLARDPKLGRDRAVKIPTEVSMNSAKARSHFLREARLAAAIDHPNVVRVVEADDLGGLCYLVMEYCAEGSLAAWLKSRQNGPPIPERWAARLVEQIADGVHEAHERGIFHRDLKPANVLLARVGPPDDADPPAFCPKVADFGLATHRDDEGTTMSAEGMPIGTYAYMSPEQVRGNRREIGIASDVYNVGAILFELLAGRRLYPMNDRELLLGALLGDGPSPSLREVRPGVSRELEIIARTCLMKDPRDRYASAAALADDLRRFVRGDPVRGAPLWKRARSLARIHRRPLAITASLMLVAATAGVALEYKRAIQARDDGEAAVWLDRVRAADIATLPELVRLHDPSDPRVLPGLMAQFGEDDPATKLNAAVMLAGLRSDCTEFAYNRLLSARAKDIDPLARVLAGRMTKIVQRLERDALATPKAATAVEAEARDRRRANVATALVLIGRPATGLAVLKFTPNPQARSFLIHTLGPAGVRPGLLFDALTETKDSSIRMALLQSLGEVPGPVWARESDLRGAIAAEALRLYRDDPHPGVHGSAKWLLRKWGRRSQLATADDEIKMMKPRYGFDWRITATGLTMVTVRSTTLDRLIEVSDTEVTVEQFSWFRQNQRYERNVSPDPDCPMNGVNFCDGALFCNWLGATEGVAEGRACYALDDKVKLFLPIANHRDRDGYRLPTDREFEVACRAGTISSRPFGDADSLLENYAVHGRLTEGRAAPVADLKPNDLGIFDMLGNMYEVCQMTDEQARPRYQSVVCGGSWINEANYFQSSVKIARVAVDQPYFDGLSGRIGFRVARSIRDQKSPIAAGVAAP